MTRKGLLGLFVKSSRLASPPANLVNGVTYTVTGPARTEKSHLTTFFDAWLSFLSSVNTPEAHPAPTDPGVV